MRVQLFLAESRLICRPTTLVHRTRFELLPPQIRKIDDPAMFAGIESRIYNDALEASNTSAAISRRTHGMLAGREGRRQCSE